MKAEIKPDFQVKSNEDEEGDTGEDSIDSSRKKDKSEPREAPKQKSICKTNVKGRNKILKRHYSQADEDE